LTSFYDADNAYYFWTLHVKIMYDFRNFSTRPRKFGESFDSKQTIQRLYNRPTALKWRRDLI
jgi:hypothetical protein